MEMFMFFVPDREVLSRQKVILSLGTIFSNLYHTSAVSPTRSVFPDLGPDPDFFPKKVWKKSDFCPKSLYFYKMATYYTFLESLGPGQCNRNIFKMF